jgi:hypothetical protein
MYNNLILGFIVLFVSIAVICLMVAFFSVFVTSALLKMNNITDKKHTVIVTLITSFEMVVVLLFIYFNYIADILPKFLQVLWN